MVSNKTVDWTAEDGSQRVSETINGFCKLFAIMICYAADKRKGHVLTSVGSDMQTDKVSEVLTYESLNCRIIKVVVYEFRKACEKTVGERLTIYAVDDLSKRQTCFLLEFFF